MRVALAALAALILAPAAAAWTPVSSTPVLNSARASVVVTPAGTELATWNDSSAGLWLWSSSGGARQIETVPFVNQPQIVQLPSGALEIYTGSGAGVERFESTDGGTTWTGPHAIVSPTTTGPVVTAAVRPDGTPMFTQDSTFGVTVFQGLNGEQSHAVFTGCCGYAESLAVDTNDYAQIAFWSNAPPGGNSVHYEGLDGNGAQAGPGLSFAQPTQETGSVPLVSAPSGYTYLGLVPTTSKGTNFMVEAFKGGNVQFTTFLAGGSFTGADPQIAVATDAQSRVWAVWTQGGTVRARRSRSNAGHFGSPSTAATGGATIYQLSALGLPDGRVDVFANNGSQLVHQTFLPALTVSATHTTAYVWDDGFGVKATLKGGGHSVKTNAAGKASLAAFRKGTHVVVGAPGYAPASFRVP